MFKEAETYLYTYKEKNEVFLAMTSLEEFWDQSMPMIFLGEWCLRYSRKFVWQGLGDKLVYQGWQSGSEFAKDCLYIEQIYEDSIISMSAILNRIHNMNFSTQYWRIIIGPWLYWYITTVYDRYRALVLASEQYENISTIGLDPRDFTVPIDTMDFVNRCKEDSYQLQIFTKIAIRLGWEMSFKRHIQPATYCGNKPSIKTKIKNKIFNVIYQNCKNKIVCNCEYFSKMSFLKISLFSKMEVVKYCEKKYPLDSISKNELLREKCRCELKQEGQDQFKNILTTMIVDDMPVVFLEGYMALNTSEHIDVNSRPKAIFSANAWYFDECFKYWSAYWRECGVPLLGTQHGGNYGSTLVHESENHERRITDKYYSWGWQGDGVQSMPSSKLAGRRPIGASNEKTGILFVTNIESRYLYSLGSITYDLSDCVNSQFIFMRSIGEDLRNQVILRLHQEDMGWDLRLRWNDFYPQVYIDDWSTPLLKRLQTCKLYVCDHLSTTFLEALSANVPTVLFWQQDHFPLREDAKKYYDELHEVGILHYSPEDAAQWVEKKYSNVEAWWKESNVQTVRRKFCSHFANTSDDYINEWVNELTNASGGGL